jgi:hypothetical protein
LRLQALLEGTEIKNNNKYKYCSEAEGKRSGFQLHAEY